MSRLTLPWLAAVVAVLPAWGQQAAGRPPARALAEFSSAVQELAASLSPAVVQIDVRSRTAVDAGEGRHTGLVANQTATGSGVIVDASGYIVTNAHVVEGARRVDVSVMDRGKPATTLAHNHYPGKIVGIDKETDLAVIRIDATGLPTIPFLDSDTLRQGQVVLALGSPLGLVNSLTVGFVSAPARHLRQDSPMTYVQTDAAINPGNSGGALLDIAGRIAGINTLILSQSGGSEGIGFAIPANTVRHVYEELRAKGHVHRGAIGVLSDEVTPTMAEALHLSRHSGVILSDVLPHSAAEAAGLQAGDIVLAINGHELAEPRQVAAEIFQRHVGEAVTLEIDRGGQKMQKTVTIMERPDSPGGLADLASDDSNVVRQLGILACTLDAKATAILGELRSLSGVVVAGIPAESAFNNPGLATGDVIVQFNGKALASLEDLRAALNATKAGAPAVLRVERESRYLYVVFELE